MDGGDEMTEEKVGELLMTIQAYYPNYNPPDKKITLNAWYIMLAEYPEELVLQALRACIATNTSGFAPDVGQIISKIQTISQPQELDGMAAWGLVSKALRNGTYGAVEEFNKLPPLVRQAVGIPDNLKNWATSDYQTIETVIQSNFLRTYEVIVKRANEINRMPDNIKSLIEKTNANSYKAQIEQKFQRDINALTVEEKTVSSENTKSENYCEAPQDIQDKINAMR